MGNSSVSGLGLGPEAPVEVGEMGWRYIPMPWCQDQGYDRGRGEKDGGMGEGEGEGVVVAPTQDSTADVFF